MATFSYLLMYFVPQFTETTDIYNNPRKCDISNVILRRPIYKINSWLRVAITYFKLK